MRYGASLARSRQNFRIPKKISETGYGRGAGASRTLIRESDLGAEREAGNPGELGGDLLACTPQHGESLAHQLGLGRPARMAGAVERRNHASVLVENWHRQGNDAIRQLVLHRGIAVAPAFLYQLPDFLGIGHRVLGQGDERLSTKVPFKTFA